MVSELRLDLLDVLFGDVVWCQDQAVVLGQMRKEGKDQALVGRPGASSDDAFPTMDERFNLGERLGLPCDGGHAIEPGVAATGDVVVADALEEPFCRLVLHEEMGHVLQLLSKPSSVPSKEILVRLEDQRDIKKRNAVFMQGVHVIEPKLIFDEKGSYEMMPFHPSAGVPWRVDGEVTHLVGQGVVFSDLVS